MAIIYAEFNFWKSEIFLPSGIDTNSENQPVGQITRRDYVNLTAQTVPLVSRHLPAEVLSSL